MYSTENEKLCFKDKNFNQKVLADGGVCLFFKNVFDQTTKSKVPIIKPKLKKILVDFGLCQTYLEINQKLDFIKIFYRDETARELKNVLLQKFNLNKSNQAIELFISLEDSLITPPDRGKIKSYPGLTKLLFQEFISESLPISMIDDNPFNEIKTIIQKGNLSPSEPLESIFRGELGNNA